MLCTFIGTSLLFEVYTTHFGKKTCTLRLRQKIGLYLCLGDCGGKSTRNEKGCGSVSYPCRFHLMKSAIKKRGCKKSVSSHRGWGAKLHFWRWWLALRYGNPYTIWKLMERRVIWYFGLLCQFSIEHNIGDWKFCSTIMRKMGCSRIPVELLPCSFQLTDENGF